MHDCSNVNECPVQTTLKVIGGKWKLPLLWYLRDGQMRYSELQRAIPGITPKMLAEQLRELEHDGLVSRKVHPVVPPKVEYGLTVYGRTLDPILKAMGSWGDRHMKRGVLKAVA
jgi:DNA-binding HxlR family transcriptional regulator